MKPKHILSLILLGLAAFVTCKSKSSDSTDSELVGALLGPNTSSNCSSDFNTAIQNAVDFDSTQQIDVTGFEADYCAFRLTSTTDSFYTITATPGAQVDIKIVNALRNVVPTDSGNSEFYNDQSGTGGAESLYYIGLFGGESRIVWVYIFNGTCGNGCNVSISASRDAYSPGSVTGLNSTGCSMSTDSMTNAMTINSSALLRGTLSGNECKWFDFTADSSHTWNYVLLSETGDDLDLYVGYPGATAPTSLYSSSTSGTRGITENIFGANFAFDQRQLIVDGFGCVGLCDYLLLIY